MSATPTIVGKGTACALGIASTSVVVFPADVSVSDFAILIGGTKGDNNGGIAPGTLWAWTQLNGVTVSQQADKLVVWYRVCDGSEDGANITVSAQGTAGPRSAQVYVFRGDPGATWKFDINAASISSYVKRTVSNTLAVPIQGISTSGANRLALNFFASGVSVATGLSFSAVTGGVMDGAGAFFDNINPRLQMHYASLTSSGSISGGIATPSAAANFLILGTAIAASGGATPQTVLATGFGASSGYGGAPFICPVGFSPPYSVSGIPAWFMQSPHAYPVVEVRPSSLY